MEIFRHQVQLGIEAAGVRHLEDSQRKFDKAKDSIVNSREIAIVRITNDEC